MNGSKRKMRSLKKYLLAVVIAGLGDALTTYLALFLGYPETQAFFVPFLATLILAVCLCIVNTGQLRCQKTEGYAKLVSYLLVGFSFSGMLWNTFVLVANQFIG